jgi:hypothetical protein
MRLPLFAFVCAASLALLGCPVTHQSQPARAQEAATELNINTRFGRMELATERVAPSAREAFLTRRKTWGNAIRIADYELSSFKMKGENDAEIRVKVAWYRIDQGDLRQTTLRQSWHDEKGEWRLVDETSADGDLGLLGETMPDAPSRPKNAQFPTVRLGQAKAPSPPAESAPSTNGAKSPAATE